MIQDQNVERLIIKSIEPVNKQISMLQIELDGIKKQLAIPRVRQSLPKQLSNAAYLNARDMDYENLVKWWDDQV